MISRSYIAVVWRKFAVAIFTKDGKVYVVEGPNPLVERQVSWDPGKLVFHNFRWDEIARASKKNAETPQPKQEPSPVATMEAPAAEKAEEPPAEPEQHAREFDLPYIKYKVLCHCLPAKVQKRTDALYGESWIKVTYGAKFVFPCVVTSSSDLGLEFWTSDPRGQVTERSVIYPFSYEVHNSDTDSYDRVPYDDYRWWKVASKESKEGGWLFTAAPSDFQPDFSD